MKCKDHPKYKGIRRPRVDCAVCLEIYYQNRYKKLIGETCCFCKDKLTKQDYDDANISLLVGGSCPKEGRPMHVGCYNKKLNHLFR